MEFILKPFEFRVDRFCAQVEKVRCTCADFLKIVRREAFTGQIIDAYTEILETLFEDPRVESEKFGQLFILDAEFVEKGQMLKTITFEVQCQNIFAFVDRLVPSIDIDTHVDETFQCCRLVDQIGQIESEWTKGRRHFADMSF